MLKLMDQNNLKYESEEHPVTESEGEDDDEEASVATENIEESVIEDALELGFVDDIEQNTDPVLKENEEDEDPNDDKDDEIKWTSLKRRFRFVLIILKWIYYNH